MALAQYRSRRDAERSCPWFDYDGDDSMTGESRVGRDLLLLHARARVPRPGVARFAD